jgi:hypothetical protein
MHPEAAHESLRKPPGGTKLPLDSTTCSSHWTPANIENLGQEIWHIPTLSLTQVHSQIQHLFVSINLLLNSNKKNPAHPKLHGEMTVFVVVGGHDRIWKMWLYVVRCRASLCIHCLVLFTPHSFWSTYLPYNEKYSITWFSMYLFYNVKI